MNSKNRFILCNLLAFEFLILNLVLVFSTVFRHPGVSFSDYDFLINFLFLIVIYNISWLFIILYIRDKEFYFNPDYSYFKSLLTSIFFFIGLIASCILLLNFNYFDLSIIILPIFIFAYIHLVSHGPILKYLKRRSSSLFANILLIGSENELTNLTEFAKAMSHFGYNLVGYLDDGKENSPNRLGLNIFGKIDSLSKVLNENSIDEVFITMSAMERNKIKESIEIADNCGVRVKLIPEYPLLLAKNYKASTMGDLAVFKLRQSPLDNVNPAIVKRLFDIGFSLLVLILASPLYLLISLLIYLESGGPIFYTPLRKGEAGKSFKCFKFRTMTECDNPMNGTKSTIKNDPRITRIGRILRKCDLDELPQFFNVLIGDMSVIGPRPHRTHLQDDFRSTVNAYMVRSYVKPGITGWAQVNGWRGPTVTIEQKEERVHHDLWYIENWSFWLDIKIIFLTIFGNHHQQAF